MPVTKEQAQMLATLAIACRPYRAPTWDEAGVMANIAKVRDRSLPEVALAVIRAAADREAVSPGVIPSNGTHWQEQLKPPKWEPEVVPKHERCRTCSQDKAGHDLTESNMPESERHEFETSEGDLRLPADHIGSVVAELRDHKASEPPPRPQPETTHQGTDRVAPVRAELAAARETEEPA